MTSKASVISPVPRVTLWPGNEPGNTSTRTHWNGFPEVARRFRRRGRRERRPRSGIAAGERTAARAGRFGDFQLGQKRSRSSAAAQNASRASHTGNSSVRQVTFRSGFATRFGSSVMFSPVRAFRSLMAAPRGASW